MRLSILEFAELSIVGRVAPSSVKNAIEHLLDDVFPTYGELTL